jgi:hypothetical protein
VPRKAAAGPGAGSLQLPDRLSVMVNDTALGGTYLGGRGWPGDRGLVVPRAQGRAVVEKTISQGRDPLPSKMRLIGRRAGSLTFRHWLEEPAAQ